MPPGRQESLFIKLPNWMGDILFSYDLLYSLSFHFERLGLCCSTEHEELFSIFPIPNAEVISYPPGSWPDWDPETIHKIEDFRADLGLVLPNSIGAAMAIRWAGVSPLYGYDAEHRGFLLAKSLKLPKHRMHQTAYYLELLRLFDTPPRHYPELPATRKEPLAVIHPGASKMERAWHRERFAALGEILETQGFHVEFVTGSPKLSLKAFTDLLKKCALFIGNDSGPLHLAQQCGATVIGIYGPGDPNVTGLRTVSRGEIVYHNFPCSPCRQKYFEECSPSPNGKPFCIETITVDEVWKVAEKVLKDGLETHPSGMEV
jgi:ADP-heptose:LPS heptosyltransferase